MVAARTLFFFEGPDMVTIVKGTALQKDETCPYMYKTLIKHRGIFGQYIPVHNIDEMYIGTPKKLFIKNKIAEGWTVIRIRKDLITHDPYIPDVPPSLVANIKSLRNEVEIWKRKYFDSKKLNEDREQRDRYKGRVLDEFDFVAKAKNKFFSSGDAWGSSFSRGWGLTPAVGTNNTNNEE